MCKSKREHIDWVDTAKSVGVILVFWGHLIYHHEPLMPIAKAIYSFHMPMFFILSGYVMQPDQTGILLYAKKKFKRLIIPTVLISTILQAIYSIFNGIENIPSFISGLFFLEGYIYFNYPAWFFFVLFETSILFKVFCLAQKDYLFLCGYCILSFCIGYVLSEANLCSWFGIDRTLIASGFMALGLIARKAKPVKLLENGVLSSMLFLIWINMANQNELCSMYGARYGNFILYISTSVVGTSLFFIFCKRVRRIPSIQYLSRHSVFIVASHYLFIWIFNDYIVWYLDMNFIMASTIVYTIIVLALYKPISGFILRVVPLLDGRLNCRS